MSSSSYMTQISTALPGEPRDKARAALIFVSIYVECVLLLEVSCFQSFYVSPLTWQQRCSGANPPLFLMYGFALDLHRNETEREKPFQEASCKAVFPC